MYERGHMTKILPTVKFFLVFAEGMLLLVKNSETGEWDLPKAKINGLLSKQQLVIILGWLFSEHSFDVSEPARLDPEVMGDDLFENAEVYVAEIIGPVPHSKKVGSAWFIKKTYAIPRISAEGFTALHSSYVQNRLT
jgi:hypothetical protein